MPNNRLGSQAQETPRPRNFTETGESEFGFVRNIDGHALKPDLVDRGDGVMIPEYRNTHIISGSLTTPEESDSPLDYPDE